ncbi:MAG: DUF6457 domain-containing protein [Nocardioidaceae bacterium]|nr:DUF6457 domain-containing protein [Nocardioidaceae bacterium]MCL2615097.1 DUF6457 domain-containing protein [Nocardioidaceae bacterium]
MNLHDWIDELCDLLDIDAEADEGLLGDLAEAASDNVCAAAGPVTAYLLGYAAGSRGAAPDVVERLAGEAQELAEGWDRPASATAEDDDYESDDSEDIDLDEEYEPA